MGHWYADVPLRYEWDGYPGEERVASRKQDGDGDSTANDADRVQNLEVGKCHCANRRWPEYRVSPAN